VSSFLVRLALAGQAVHTSVDVELAADSYCSFAAALVVAGNCFVAPGGVLAVGSYFLVPETAAAADNFLAADTAGNY